MRCLRSIQDGYETGKLVSGGLTIVGAPPQTYKTVRDDPGKISKNALVGQLVIQALALFGALAIIRQRKFTHNVLSWGGITLGGVDLFDSLKAHASRSDVGKSDKLENQSPATTLGLYWMKSLVRTFAVVMSITAYRRTSLLSFEGFAALTTLVATAVDVQAVWRQRRTLPTWNPTCE